MLVYKQTTPPAQLAITLDEAKAQLNVETAFTDDDPLITSMINAAALFVEKIIQGPLMTQAWEVYAEDWEDVFEIQKERITAVGSVKYYDSNNADQTVNPSDYQEDLSSVPARIIFNSSFAAPDVYDRFDAIRIAITAGYANAAAVPEDLKRWIKVLVTQFYESRDASQVKPEIEDMVKRGLMTYAAWL